MLGLLGTAQCIASQGMGIDRHTNVSYRKTDRQADNEANSLVDNPTDAMSV